MTLKPLRYGDINVVDRGRLHNAFDRDGGRHGGLSRSIVAVMDRDVEGNVKPDKVDSKTSKKKEDDRADRCPLLWRRKDDGHSVSSNG